jgi:hypothetical protein
MRLIWVSGEANYFFAGDWTGKISLISKENFPSTRNKKSGIRQELQAAMMTVSDFEPGPSLDNDSCYAT